MGGEPGFTFGVLRQDSGEAAQRSQLEGEAERVDADADEGHDAGVLQGVQHAGFLTELREVLHGIHGSQVLQHGIWQDTQPPSHCPAQSQTVWEVITEQGLQEEGSWWDYAGSKALR